MDTSETYIKMSKKAKKFLPEHKWSSGDFFSYKYEVQTYEDWSFSEGIIEDMIKSGDCVPLYRQDQLQAILLSESYTFAALFCDFWWLYSSYDEALGSYDCDKGRFTSMEQLWLVFVMKKKYNKIWDEEEWREINVLVV